MRIALPEKLVADLMRRKTRQLSLLAFGCISEIGRRLHFFDRKRAKEFDYEIDIWALLLSDAVDRIENKQRRSN